MLNIFYLVFIPWVAHSLPNGVCPRNPKYMEKNPPFPWIWYQEGGNGGYLHSFTLLKTGFHFVLMKWWNYFTA